MKWLFTVITAVIVFQLIILANFRILVYDMNYYKNQLSAAGTYNKVQIGDEADAITSNLIDYFQGKTESVKSKVFNEQEISHLADVKSLINATITYLYLLTMALFAIIGAAITIHIRKRNRKALADFIANASAIGSAAVIMTAALLFIAASSFLQLFDAFHTPFFKPGTYTFPETDALIMLYPEQFFYNFTYDIILRSAITAVTLLAIALIARHMINRTNSKTH